MSSGMPELRRARDVAQPLAQLALRARTMGGSARSPTVQVQRASQTTATKLAALNRKQTPDADRRDEDAADRRADDAGEVHHRRVEAHRVAQAVAPDHLEHERLPRGVLEGVVEAEERGQHADLPEPDLAGDRQDARGRAPGSPSRSAGAIIRRSLLTRSAMSASVGPEDEDGQGLQRDDDAEGGRRVAQRDDTSHASAVICIQVPVSDTDCPAR